MEKPHETMLFSMHANKGVYALLLGSGISRAAGIKTGWEVMMDLIAQLRLLRETIPDKKLSNSEWYIKEFGIAPNYSDILRMVGKTSAERSAKLRPYFEPPDSETDSNRPSEAHKAIAQLMKNKVVRIVVTTNFDRLLEQACYLIGFEPLVIDRPSAIHGMVPISHQEHLIFKIHGDYKNPETLNTADEISNYKPVVRRFLGQVFEEFGLIICGWSGDWDIALVDAMDKCKNRRFPVYWAAYQGKLSEKSKELATRRGAHIVSINGADEFFTKCHTGIVALENHNRPSTLSLNILLSSFKKSLTANHSSTLVDELMSEEEGSFQQEFETILQRIDKDSEQLSSYYFSVEGISVRFISLLFLLGKYMNESLFKIATLTLERQFSNLDTTGRQRSSWIRCVPPALFCYGLGLGLLYNAKYEYFSRMMVVQVEKPSLKYRKSFQQDLRASLDIYRPFRNSIEDVNPFNASEFAFERVHQILGMFFPNINAFTSVFDLFEYLVYLNQVDYQYDGDEFTYIKNCGGFILRRIHDFSPTMHIINMIRRERSSCKLLVAGGPFQGSLERLQAAVQYYEKVLHKETSSIYWHGFPFTIEECFSKQDLLS
ncbi:MAG: SIR2 family protein [Planctomycetes bacterium]|nr:SIR2 family protein [Planctomycetota bacterium]